MKRLVSRRMLTAAGRRVRLAAAFCCALSAAVAPAGAARLSHAPPSAASNDVPPLRVTAYTLDATLTIAQPGAGDHWTITIHEDFASSSGRNPYSPLAV